MEIIKYSCYKYAPETARATVNGQPVNIAGTMIPQMIATGQKSEAEKALKKAYRKQNAAESSYIYAFFAAGTTQFYYITALRFTAADDIKTRLHCYKELKHHLQNHPQTITTEAGYITPTGKTAPKVTTEQIKIDFKKCKKMKIKFA